MSDSNRAVCVECNIQMRIASDRHLLIELYSDPPEPYKIRRADVLRCPVCGLMVAVGFGDPASVADKHRQEIQDAISHGRISWEYERTTDAWNKTEIFVNLEDIGGPRFFVPK